jgi:hypothetical protein
MSSSCFMALACDLRPDTPPDVLHTLVQRYDLPLETPSLCLRRSVADDELDEHLTLLEQLAPYSATRGFVGYVRLGWDVSPTLIYFRDGAVSIL